MTDCPTAARPRSGEIVCRLPGPPRELLRTSLPGGHAPFRSIAQMGGGWIRLLLGRVNHGHQSHRAMTCGGTDAVWGRSSRRITMGQVSPLLGRSYGFLFVCPARRKSLGTRIRREVFAVLREAGDWSMRFIRPAPTRLASPLGSFPRTRLFQAAKNSDPQRGGRSSEL